MDARSQTRAGAAVGALRPVAETAAMVAGSTLAGLLVAPRWGNSPVDLLYLPAVLAAGGFYGLRMGLVAAIASSLAFNFFFTVPLHTFRVASPNDLVTVVLLFLVALVTSQLAGRMRESARDARASASRNATIAGLARQLLTCANEQQIAEVATGELGRLLDCNAVLLDARDPPTVLAARPARETLTPSDVAMAAWAISEGVAAGRGEGRASTTEWLFLPIRSGGAVLGAIGLARDDGGNPAPSEGRELLGNLIDQVALALERARLEREARGADELRERNRMRAALLATIGSDVEPRLRAIGEGVDSIRRSGGADKAVLGTVASELGRLRLYLSNLLDLGDEAEQRPVRVGAVTIDLFRRAVARDGRPVHLSPKEYAVLAELAKYPGRVLDHAHLLRAAWGPAHETHIDYLRVAVRGLRLKLEEDPARPGLVINEPGVGYRLAAG